MRKNRSASQLLTIFSISSAFLLEIVFFPQPYNYHNNTFIVIQVFCQINFFYELLSVLNIVSHLLVQALHTTFIFFSEACLTSNSDKSCSLTLNHCIHINTPLFNTKVIYINVLAMAHDM